MAKIWIKFEVPENCKHCVMFDDAYSYRGYCDLFDKYITYDEYTDSFKRCDECKQSEVKND